jgi:hypothetical protein
MVARAYQPEPQRRLSLRVVETMCVAADGDEPGRAAYRVKNTIRCSNTLCRLPLMDITTDKAYIPLHAKPLHYLRPTPHFLLTCPACGTARTVEQR